MKNYTLKSSEEKDFIVKYEIDKKTNEIIITFADNKSIRIPNTIKNQITLLMRMKKQVEYYRNFEEDAKKKIRSLRISQLMELIFAILITILVAVLGVKAFTIGWKGLLLTPFILTSGMGLVGTKIAFNSASIDIDRMKERLHDFKKSMFFLHQEKVFANERLLRPDVAPKTPKKVRNLIEQAKEEEIKEDLPIINYNNIEEFTMHELKKTYALSLQSHGPVLTMKPINKNK